MQFLQFAQFDRAQEFEAPFRTRSHACASARAYAFAAPAAMSASSVAAAPMKS